MDKDYDNEVCWQVLPLNVLSRGGVTEELCNDIIKVVEKHGMFETSCPSPGDWTDSLGVECLDNGTTLESWMKELEDERNGKV